MGTTRGAGDWLYCLVTQIIPAVDDFLREIEPLPIDGKGTPPTAKDRQFMAFHAGELNRLAWYLPHRPRNNWHEVPPSFERCVNDLCGGVPGEPFWTDRDEAEVDDQCDRLYLALRGLLYEGVWAGVWSPDREPWELRGTDINAARASLAELRKLAGIEEPLPEVLSESQPGTTGPDLATIIECVSTIVGSEATEIIRICSDSKLTAEQKCYAIVKMEPSAWFWDSPRFAKATGTTAANIRQMHFWKVDRSKLIRKHSEN